MHCDLSFARVQNPFGGLLKILQSQVRKERLKSQGTSVYKISPADPEGL